jgi:hypothetical protein
MPPPKRVILDKIFLENLPRIKNKFRIMTVIKDVKTDEILFQNDEDELAYNF